MKPQRSTKRLGWLLMFISLLGVIIGFVSGGAIFSAVLHAHGRGESHAYNMLIFTMIIAALSILVGSCRTAAARSSDDMVIFKQFVSEALMRMDDLKRATYSP